MKKNKSKKNKFSLFFVFAVPTAIVLAGLDSRLNLVKYDLTTNKISEKIKICLIADLHSCNYGKNQCEIFEIIDKEKPDVVLLAGDIIDDEMPEEKAIEFLKILGQKYESYYVTGNHEFATHDVNRIKKVVAENNITVLDGITKQVNIKNQILDLSGIDDPKVGNEIWKRQLEKASNERKGNFSVLLTHRPERIDRYSELDYDLVVAGHAHGGQWRIPFLINGVIAPNQGILPKYAGGEYTVNNSKLIVSRGLARESTKYVPRIYNRPEVVIINIE